MLALACGLLGVAVGSLLTVVVDRVPAKQPVASATLALLRHPGPVARARHTPLLQLLTGGLFTLAALRFGADWALPAYLVFLASMVAVTLIDLEHSIVPNRIVVATLAVSLPLLAAAALLGGTWSSLGTALLGALAGGGSLLAVNLISPRGMGMGDVKLAVVLGLFLGWIDLGHVLLGLFLGFLLGAGGGVVLIALKLRTRRDHVPFAPFLAGGAVLAVLAGNAILDWYL
ncbi:MAG: A24 family peptidase [Actinobacteria bacterium]|nr:A24 family peptidase [Actinomycetota bacterium]